MSVWTTAEFTVRAARLLLRSRCNHLALRAIEAAFAVLQNHLEEIRKVEDCRLESDQICPGTDFSIGASSRGPPRAGTLPHDHLLVLVNCESLDGYGNIAREFEVQRDANVVSDAWR